MTAADTRGHARIDQLGDAAQCLDDVGLVVLQGVLDKSTVEYSTRVLNEAIEDRIKEPRERAKYDAGVSAGYTVGRLLEVDDVFVDILLHPMMQALVSAALDGRGRVSSCRGWSKGRGHAAVPLHADQKLFGMQPLGINVTIALTPYELGSGPLVFEAGSHRRNRQPRPDEGYRGPDGEDPDELLAAWIAGHPVSYEWPAGAEAVLAPAGSLIAWYGPTWHGADARSDPGRRLSLVYYFEHELLIPQEVYRDAALGVTIDYRRDQLEAVLGGRHPAWR